jgi:hypothetical protein
MPSHEHESIVDLLGDAPADLADILRAAGGVDVPLFVKMERVDPDLTQTLPVQYAADGVFRFFGHAERCVLVVILEVQRQPDPDKLWTWPMYLTVTRARERCETILAVLATNEATADWARRGISLDRNCLWRPLVIGPSTLPSVATIETAKARPVLAIVWALTHAQQASDAPSVKAVLEGVALSGLEKTLVTYYSDVILEAASEQVRRLVEALMRVPENYEIKNPFLRSITTEAKMAGRSEGLNEGRTEGRAEVLESIRSVLYACVLEHGLVLSAAERAIVDECQEAATLARWTARIALAKTSSDIFSGTDQSSH